MELTKRKEATTAIIERVATILSRCGGELYGVKLELFVVNWEEAGSENSEYRWVGLYISRVVGIGKVGRTIKRIYLVLRFASRTYLFAPIFSFYLISSRTHFIFKRLSLL